MVALRCCMLCFVLQSGNRAAQCALPTFVSSVTADFSIEPFSNGTQDADVCAHRKFRCGRYDVPIRIAIFVDDAWKSRYCGPEFSFRARIRNVIMWKCDKNDTRSRFITRTSHRWDELDTVFLSVNYKFFPRDQSMGVTICRQIIL